jgi:hypothetical protein
MNDKLKKLERIAEILDAQTDNSEALVLLERILALEDQIKLIEAKPLDFTTKEEVEGVFNLLQDSLNEIKSNDKTQELEAQISQLLAEHRKLNKDKDYSDDYFNKELQTLKNVVADIKAIKPQEIDINSIIQEVYQTVKDEVVKLIPEVKEVSPETIIEQIEERQLDVSSIKGLQEMVEKLTKDQKKTIIGANKPLSGLLDVNVAGILPDQSIKWNGQTWVAYTPSAGGESAFQDLTDTPNSYTSQAGKGVRVKGTEDGLEFYTTSDSDEKVKLNASDPTAGYLDDKITGYGFLDDASAFATSAQGLLADTALQSETDPVFSAWLLATPPLYSESDTLQTITDRGATTTKDITAKSFIKTGGTSSEFLKADGSSDSNTYLTGETDPLSLHLDQTTPQSIINGYPINASQPSFTYTTGVLTKVDYPSGFNKVLAYNLDGTLDTITYSNGVIKTMVWSSGVLQNIIVT